MSFVKQPPAPKETHTDLDEQQVASRFRTSLKDKTHSKYLKDINNEYDDKNSLNNITSFLCELAKIDFDTLKTLQTEQCSKNRDNF